MKYLNKYFYRIIRDMFENESFTYELDEDKIILWADNGDRLEYIYYADFKCVEDIIRKIEELI